MRNVARLKMGYYPLGDVKEELRQGRRCQVYATYTGEKDVTQRSWRHFAGRTADRS